MYFVKYDIWDFCLVLKFKNFKHKRVKTKLDLDFISISQEENSGKVSFNRVSLF